MGNFNKNLVVLQFHYIIYCCLSDDGGANVAENRKDIICRWLVGCRKNRKRGIYYNNMR